MPNVNLSANPSGAVDVSDWLGSGTKTRLTGLSGPPRATGGSVAIGTGSYSASIGPGAASTSTGGVPWTGVCWLRCTVARTVQVALGTFNSTTFVSGNGYTGANNVSLTANTWTQVRALGTLPTANSFNAVSLIIDLPTTGSSGTLSLSSARLDNYSDSSLTYADGGTSGWVWDGTSGKSTSRLVLVESGRFFFSVG